MVGPGSSGFATLFRGKTHSGGGCTGGRALYLPLKLGTDSTHGSADETGGQPRYQIFLAGLLVSQRQLSRKTLTHLLERFGDGFFRCALDRTLGGLRQEGLDRLRRSLGSSLTNNLLNRGTKEPADTGDEALSDSLDACLYGRNRNTLSGLALGEFLFATLRGPVHVRPHEERSRGRSAPKDTNDTPCKSACARSNHCTRSSTSKTADNASPHLGSGHSEVF